MISEVTVLCHACRAEIHLIDPWAALGTVVECGACRAQCYIYIDENADCDYWFGTEPPEATSV